MSGPGIFQIYGFGLTYIALAGMKTVQMRRRIMGFRGGDLEAEMQQCCKCYFIIKIHINTYGTHRLTIITWYEEGNQMSAIFILN